MIGTKSLQGFYRVSLKSSKLTTGRFSKEVLAKSLGLFNLVQLIYGLITFVTIPSAHRAGSFSQGLSFSRAGAVAFPPTPFLLRREEPHAGGARAGDGLAVPARGGLGLRRRAEVPRGRHGM